MDVTYSGEVSLSGFHQGSVLKSRIESERSSSDWGGVF